MARTAEQQRFYRRKQMERRAQRQSMGLCGYCGGKPVGGLKTCQRCRENHRRCERLRRARYRKSIKKGQHTCECGKPVIGPNGCITCTWIDSNYITKREMVLSALGRMGPSTVDELADEFGVVVYHRLRGQLKTLADGGQIRRVDMKWELTS